MSRLGNIPITIPAGVTVSVAGQAVTVKGKLGELSYTINDGITVSVDGALVHCTRASDDREHKAFHGLVHALVHNMIVGVSEGYKKVLTIEGTGFKAVLQGKDKLALSLGFASPKIYDIPQGLKITVDPTSLIVTIEGIDKALVGEAAARIRHYYPAEPYKGKGIKYQGEQIRRKQGKTVA